MFVSFGPLTVSWDKPADLKTVAADVNFLKKVATVLVYGHNDLVRVLKDRNKLKFAKRITKQDFEN